MQRVTLDIELLITRPADQAKDWVTRLAQRGLVARSAPLMTINALSDPRPLRAAWQAIADYRLMVFVSPTAVDQFFTCKPSTLGTLQHPWPKELLLASPGPGTTARLLEHGVPLNLIVEPAADSTQFDSEALWQRLGLFEWTGASVMMVSGDGGRGWLAHQLKNRGARVDTVVAYRRGAPHWTAQLQSLAQDALSRPERYLWMFSSSEAIGHLIARYPAPCWSKSLALTTHPRISESANQAGFGRVYLSRPTMDAIIACIQSAPNANPP